MSKRIKLKKKQPLVLRHIEDAPFYRYVYEHDDLPLDPAKDFILEQIGNFFHSVQSFFFSFNYFQLKSSNWRVQNSPMTWIYILIHRLNWVTISLVFVFPVIWIWLQRNQKRNFYSRRLLIQMILSGWVMMRCGILLIIRLRKLRIIWCSFLRIEEWKFFKKIQEQDRRCIRGRLEDFGGIQLLWVSFFFVYYIRDNSGSWKRIFWSLIGQKLLV